MIHKTKDRATQNLLKTRMNSDALERSAVTAPHRTPVNLAINQVMSH